MLLRGLNAIVTVYAGTDARTSFRGHAAEVADLMESRVNEIAAEIGQSPVSVRFNKVKSGNSPAGYNVAEDVIYIHPDELNDPALGLKYALSYAFHGVILHELGHRANPQPIVKRIRLIFGPLAVIVFCFLPIAVCILLGLTAGVNLFALVILAAFTCFLFSARLSSPVAWAAEYEADDFCCDHAGIGVAAALLNDAVCNLAKDQTVGEFTHPAPLDRFHRQMDRAGLPRPPELGSSTQPVAARKP